MRMTDGTALAAGLPRSWSSGCPVEQRTECLVRPPYAALRLGEKVRRPLPLTSGSGLRQTFRIRSAISGLTANPAALYVATPPTLELGVHTRTLDEPISRSAAAPATVIARP